MTLLVLAVISHVNPNGKEQTIAYASRTLYSSERNYSQIEKEALAIVFGINKFHQCLYGRRFTLVTNHQPLTTILGPKKALAASRIQRWALLLSAYNYVVKYRSTKEHTNADALSRLPFKHQSVGCADSTTDLKLKCFGEFQAVTKKNYARSDIVVGGQVNTMCLAQLGIRGLEAILQQKVPWKMNVSFGKCAW